MKKIELRNKVTGEIQYPVTSIDNVLVDEDKTLKETLEEDKSITPYPGEREIVYTTIDGEPIEFTDSNIESNIYYKDKGFGVIKYSKTITNVDFVASKKVRSIILPSEGIANTIYLKCANCTNLETFIFSNTIVNFRTGVYQGSFENCVNLKNVILSENLLWNNAYATFRGCSSLTSIILPDSIEAMPQIAFGKCYSLTKINIPSKVTIIPDSCFINCESLTNISLHSGITEIGGSAFAGCISLISINLPNTLTTISKNCFSECHSLKNFSIPSSVTTIGDSAFSYCKANLEIGNTNITTYGNSCFSYSGITKLRIGSGNKTYEAHCFQQCWGLKELIVQSTTELDTWYFYGSGGVEYIDTVAPSLTNYPSANNLKTLILRYNGVVKDTEEYVTTFIEDNPEKEAMIRAAEEQGIMPLTNLDTYIGTPNNWLKIYVPKNYLNQYKETYPTLKNHFHPITGEEPVDYYTKEEVSEMVSTKANSMTIQSASGTTLTAEDNTYYRFDEVVDTLNITLPTVSSKGTVILNFTTGFTPAITIQSSQPVSYFSGYSIYPNTTYELNIMFNGLKWIVAYGTIE